MKHLLILLTILLSSTQANAQTTTWDKDGWVVTATHTNPSTVAGTTINLEATVTYEVDGIAQPQTEAATLALVVAPSISKKITTSKVDLSKQYTIASKTGDGDAVFLPDGKLQFSVAAPNDGVVHTFSFKLKTKPPEWGLGIVPVKVGG